MSVHCDIRCFRASPAGRSNHVKTESQMTQKHEDESVFSFTVQKRGLFTIVGRNEDSLSKYVGSTKHRRG